MRKVLTREGLVVNKHRPKHNFQTRDLTRLLLTLWTKDDLSFTPERYRIQFTFIIRVYCWTGARLSAFFTNGLRYRDVDLVLQRTSTGRWRLIYKIDQRWVKNNRDPENIVFGTAGREHDRFIYDDSAFLLTMAMADKALFGYETFADLQEQEIPPGENELVLRFKEAMLDKPILRKCTKASGVTDEPMPRSAFSDILRNTFRNAGYLCTTSVHAIRRQLGKKVDEIYTEVQRSHHLTQADPRIFGQSYVANTSSVDGQAAFLGEQVDHSHIDYFQSLEKFREPGLPCELPAHIEESLRQDRRRQELELEVQKSSEKDPLHLKEFKKRLASYLKTLKGSALRQYQESWIQQRRDWKIITRGREQARDLDRTDLVQSLCLLFPERARLAQRLASDEPLTAETKWLAMEDLYTLCTRDFPVLYLPGCQPVVETCPVECCQLALERLPKDDRNQHVQVCVRREIASKGHFLQSDVHYCHLCFDWVVGQGVWDSHCQTHLQKLPSKQCGTITYCHTLVRAGYCPFCLGDAAEQSAGRRLESWRRDHALWKHIETHLERRRWPLVCPHPLCDTRLSHRKDLQFHFVDEHGLSRTRPKERDDPTTPSSSPTKKSSPKRKSAGDGGELFCASPKQFSPSNPPKRICRNLSTISPSLLSDPDYDVKYLPPAYTGLTEPPPAAVAEPPPPRDGGETCWSVDQVDLDHMSPVELWSCDSTLIDSPPYDDSLFSQFMRSPSPDCVSISTDAKQGAINAPDSDLLSSNTDQDRIVWHDQEPCHPREACNKIRIHLQVKPPKTTITLRCSAPKSKQQGARRPRRTKSARRR